jgi:iron complex transport system ATP-binding protein
MIAAGFNGTPPAIEMQGVSVTIGNSPLLTNVNLHIQRGEFVAIVGPNGAGKSTLLAALAGDIAPVSGSVQLNGTDVRQMKPKRLAQTRSVLPQQTRSTLSFLAEEIVLMGRHSCIENGEDRTIVVEAMRATDTARFVGRPFPTLSGGEQALVNLARILVQQAPIVLLDEPTAALDIAYQERVCAIAATMRREQKTVVAVLHDLNLAARYASRIVLLRGGCVAADGPPSCALTEPTLSSVYATPITVRDHPLQRNVPMVLPISQVVSPPWESIGAVPPTTELRTIHNNRTLGEE